MDDIDPINPYAELRTLMRSLERRGCPVSKIIDAAMVLSANAAARLYGPEAAASSLMEMAALVDDGPTPPPPECRLH